MTDVLNKLTELGYKTKLDTYDTYYDIIVEANSYYTFNDDDKDIVRGMVGKDLLEFYYGGNQHIFVRRNIIKERTKKINKILSNDNLRIKN